MGLFAQVGGAGTTTIWRISFVGIAVVGLVATLRALPHSRRSEVDDTADAGGAVVIYALIAVVGRDPGDRPHRSTSRPSRSRRSCSILLVLSAHGLVWRFMTSRAPVRPARSDDSAGLSGSDRHDPAPLPRSSVRSAAGSATSWPASGRPVGRPVPGRRAGPPATWCATSSSGSRPSSPRGRTCDLPAGPSVDDDPAGAWHHLQREVQAHPRRPGVGGPGAQQPAHRRRPAARRPSPSSSPATSSCTPGTWPAPPARTTPSTRSAARRCWPGMEPIEGLMRGSGQYGAAGRGTGRRGRADQDAGIHRPRSRVEAPDVCLGLARDDHADPLPGHPDRHQLAGVGAPRRPRRARRAAQAQGLRHRPQGDRRA